MAELTATRTPSLRSVSSAASVASVVSLTRRPRIRGRSKTITGADSSPRVDNFSNGSPVSDLPYLDQTLVQEPSPGPSSMETLTLPPRPPRSPQRDENLAPPPEIHQMASTVPNESQIIDSAIPKSTEEQAPLAEEARTSSVEPTISGSSYMPSVIRIHTNLRDSLMTQNSMSTSGASSSLYPPSTSTASGTESPPSPQSMSLQGDSYDVSFHPDVDEVEEYDGDDVSYRLRLLVKNNYFLPPAHSKPSPSDFAATLPAPKRPARVAPTFLDLFRVGKSKWKPQTPAATNLDPRMPVLRTTSDSTTVSAYSPHPQPRLSSQIPRSPVSPNMRERSGRVVVVREKMNDLIVAAKQAEQDMKSRGVRREPDGREDKQRLVDDVIDPTDAVDIPPPSSSYPFAVQASALHGLGVQDSVGAALLADRLPPPTSPGKSSSTGTEDDWRKALLQEAVHHSLDNSADLSSFSGLLVSSTPLASPRVSGLTSSRGPSPSTKRMLDQHIMTQPPISPETHSQTPRLLRKKSDHSQKSARTKGLTLSTSPDSNASARSSYLPLRADTPSGPLTPLTPPPRRFLINPLYSLSQTDLTQPERPYPPPLPPNVPLPSVRTIRKVASSPVISDTNEASSSRSAMVITPPPMPLRTANSWISQDNINTSFETSRERVAAPSITTSASHYSDDEHDAESLPRTSIALSALNGRPSLSEYSQASPTTSDFQDLLSADMHHTMSFNLPLRRSMDHQLSGSAEHPGRFSTMSPPPRISSSLAHDALTPAPRSPSYHYQSIPSRLVHSTPISSEPIFEPEPITPPLPLSQRHSPGFSASPQSSPSTHTPGSIHSAPGPSSLTSFFDTIQTQPNAMDDLESSSDESDDDDVEDEPREEPRMTPKLFVDPRTRAISNASAISPRPNIMRLGNHSTPYVTRSPDAPRPSLPFGVKDPKQPIGYVPTRQPFFTERAGKSDHGHGSPVTPFDFYKYAQQHSLNNSGEGTSDLRRPGRSSSEQRTKNATNPQSDQRAQESLRRLDGMLIQHMEAEKDTIKRIASSLHSNPK